MTTMKPIRVEIDEKNFWRLYKMPMHPISHNTAVLKELLDAGIPVEGGIELRGVKHGKLSMWNEHRDGAHLHIYEWTPMADSEDDL